MSIEKHEITLKGSWEFDGRNVVADDVCKRIEHLTLQQLKKIATDVSGWNVLYQDPNDGRFWELTYPNSEMHGGGPPSLTVVSPEVVKNKYEL